MTTNSVATPPSISWAQGNSTVFLTINVECEKPDIKFEKSSVSFEGIGKSDDKLYGVVIPLYADIDPEKSSYNNKGRIIEVTLTKANKNVPFWPFLTSDKKKRHWLKIDFDRWEDEGDSGEEIDEQDDTLQRMGVKDFAGDESSEEEEEEDLPGV